MELLHTGYRELAEYFHYNGNKSESQKCLCKSGEFGRSYHYYLLKAIQSFKYSNDPQLALKDTDDARQIAGSDKSWKYSKAFLLFSLGDYAKALSEYVNIRNQTFQGEETIVDSVIDFVKIEIAENPERKDYYFILGYLEYTKRADYHAALGYFELLLANPQFDNAVLIKRTKAYIFDVRALIKDRKPLSF